MWVVWTFFGTVLQCIHAILVVRWAYLFNWQLAKFSCGWTGLLNLCLESSSCWIQKSLYLFYTQLPYTIRPPSGLNGGHEPWSLSFVTDRQQLRLECHSLRVKSQTPDRLESRPPRWEVRSTQLIMRLVCLLFIIHVIVINISF